MNEREADVMHFWKNNNIYQKTKTKVRKKRKFYFLDGPPYATGSIHLGTAWNKILKDMYIRFFRMNGFDVWDQPGYDTHGLPIENKVQEELKIKSKQEIEKLGIEKFILACRNYATRFIGVMNGQFENLGVWMDWANPYLTLTNEYIEGAWHTFKIAYEKGLLFQDSYSVHVCPHCETAVAYNEIEYEKVTDPSIYVKFPVSDNVSLVIWTTTPWTIPSNTGIMAKPNADYVKVQVGKEILIVAKDLLESLMSRIGIDYKVVEDFKGKKLEGLRYTHPLRDALPFIKELKNAHRVVLSDQFVSLTEGTGLVHTAPGHGEEDYKVGKANGLPVVNPLDMSGHFGYNCGRYAGVAARDANAMIIEDLRAKGALIAEEKLTHDYPLCWRCASHLLQMAVPQWFFRVTALREKLIKENKTVNWQPDWAQKRFHNWLESLGDWPISRQRYWGIPLPIWVCSKCNATKVIGSAKELPAKLKDLHRPYIDEIILNCKCGGKMKRISDVLDVWFDSGLAAWASLGYPKDKKLFKKLWPCDFQTEGPDQIRGWWNSQLITSVITFDKAPFKNILFHGFVLDAHGMKMSKSKGNVVTPEQVIEKYSRDVLRYYFITGTPWNDFYFKWTEVEEIAKSFTVVENTFNFVKTYASKVQKPKKLNVEDKWILSRLNGLIENCTENFKTYNGHKAALDIHDFVVNDFSRWYIKLVRDRVWPSYEGSDRAAAMHTLYEVSRNIVRLLAPITPFLAEHVHTSVLKHLGASEESIHLSEWPKADKKAVDKKLNKEMHLCREIVEAANALRHENKIKARWPLSRLSIEGVKIAKDMDEIIKSMCNVKNVSYAKIKGTEKKTEKFTIYLDTVLTKELKEEALLREVIRKVQDMRKKSKMVVKDKIILTLDNCSELEKFSALLKKEVGAEKIIFGSAEPQLEFEGKKIGIEIKRI